MRASRTTTRQHGARGASCGSDGGFVHRERNRGVRNLLLTSLTALAGRHPLQEPVAEGSGQRLAQLVRLLPEGVRDAVLPLQVLQIVFLAAAPADSDETLVLNRRVFRIRIVCCSTMDQAVEIPSGCSGAMDLSCGVIQGLRQRWRCWGEHVETLAVAVKLQYTNVTVTVQFTNT